MRSARIATSKAFIASSIVLAAASGLAPALDPAIPPFVDPIEVSHGIDLLQSSGTLHLEVPANFFAAGSSAFTGSVSVVGKKVGTDGPYEYGTASVVLERRTTIELPLPSSGAEKMVVRVIDLQLVGPQPISVQVGGTTQQWTVGARLAETQADLGSYELERTSSSGGTMTALLRVPLVATFKRSNQIKVLDLGVVELASSQGTWSTIDASATAGLLASRLPVGVALTCSTLDSPQLDLSISPAAVDANRPGPAYVAASADIDPEVGTLGRYCSIGDDAVIAAGAVIGPHASIGSGVSIGENVIIGDWVSIGSDCSIADDSIIDSHATIMSGTVVGIDSMVGANSTIGEACVIGDEVSISNAVVLQDGVTIGDGATLGPGVQVGDDADVVAGIELSAGAVVAANAVQAHSIVRRFLAGGGVELRSLPATSWPQNLPAGVIQQETAVRFKEVSLASETLLVEAVEQVPPGNPPPPGEPGYEDLYQDIGSTIAPPTQGGSGKEYNDENEQGDDYMCGWFAEQLRALLASKGYTTTFTLVRRLNPFWTPAKGRWSRMEKWLESHCLTDVHLGGGKVAWIEAQWCNGDGDNDGFIDPPYLDGDGDGVVEYSLGDSSELTDGDFNIQVYNSRADAEQSGANKPSGN